MAKFKKGDRVQSVKTGERGIVDEVYGEEKYAVLFDGASNPDRVEGFQIKAANGCASTNSVIANAMAAKNAPGMKSGIVKEFTGYSKAALGDIRRQCNESLAVIKAQGKRLQEYAEKSGLSVEWSAIVDKGVIYVGVIQGILRDLDHAVSRY